MKNIFGGRCVAIATILPGVAHTVFSQWLNTEIREAWAYRALMPLFSASMIPVKSGSTQAAKVVIRIEVPFRAVGSARAGERSA